MAQQGKSYVLDVTTDSGPLGGLYEGSGSVTEGCSSLSGGAALSSGLLLGVLPPLWVLSS